MNSVERCNELIKEKHANWIGISNQVAIKEVLDDRFKLQARTDRLTVKLEKKEKIIDAMAKYIMYLDIDEDICMRNTTNTELCNEEYTNCKQCIIEYFEKKVGE